MTSFSARDLPGWTPDRVHRIVQVFAGPDPGHRALTGQLTMRPDEAQAFLALVAAGEARRVHDEQRARADEIAPTIPDDEVYHRAEQMHDEVCGTSCNLDLGGWAGLARARLADERAKAGA